MKLCRTGRTPGPRLGTNRLKGGTELNYDCPRLLPALSFSTYIFTTHIYQKSGFFFFFLTAHSKEASFIKDSSAYFISVLLLSAVPRVTRTGVIFGKSADLHTTPNECKLLPESECGGSLETVNICGLILLTHADLLWALFVSLFINVSLEWVPSD